MEGGGGGGATDILFQTQIQTAQIKARERSHPQLPVL